MRLVMGTGVTLEDGKMTGNKEGLNQKVQGEDAAWLKQVVNAGSDLHYGQVQVLGWLFCLVCVYVPWCHSYKSVHLGNGSVVIPESLCLQTPFSVTALFVSFLLV